MPTMTRGKLRDASRQPRILVTRIHEATVVSNLARRANNLGAARTRPPPPPTPPMARQSDTQPSMRAPLPRQRDAPRFIREPLPRQSCTQPIMRAPLTRARAEHIRRRRMYSSSNSMSGQSGASTLHRGQLHVPFQRREFVGPRNPNFIVLRHRILELPARNEGNNMNPPPPPPRRPARITTQRAPVRVKTTTNRVAVPISQQNNSATATFTLFSLQAGLRRTPGVVVGDSQAPAIMGNAHIGQQPQLLAVPAKLQQQPRANSGRRRQGREASPQPGTSQFANFKHIVNYTRSQARKFRGRD